MKLTTLLCCLSLSLFSLAPAAETAAEIKDPAISGGVADGKVRLVIEGLLNGQPGDKDKLIFSTGLPAFHQGHSRQNHATTSG